MKVTIKIIMIDMLKQESMISMKISMTNTMSIMIIELRLML